MNAQDRKILEKISSNWLMASILTVIATVVDLYFLGKEIFSGEGIDTSYALKLSVAGTLLIILSWWLIGKYQQSKKDLKGE